jgi:HlyD family secretion protein
MAGLNKHEIQSPEMQDVMSEIPGSFLKWGLFLFFSIIMSLLAVSYFINSPTRISAPVTFTCFNSPTPIVAKSTGKISELFIKNEEFVAGKQFVALIHNTARWSNIKQIDYFLDSLKPIFEWQKIVAEITPPSLLSLGEVQISYSKFLSLFIQFKEYLSQSYIPFKLILLEKQIARQEEYILELKNLEQLSKEDLGYTKNKYKCDSNLYLKSNNSISINQLEKLKLVLLQKEVSFSSLKSSIKNNEISALKMKETRLDLMVQQAQEMQQYKLGLDEAFQLLQYSIDLWKENYLIQSPIDGRIAFTSYWNINQIIKAGEVLATVIPEDPGRIIVRASVPASGLGRVKVGQDVNIKLSGFPYMEFGVIKGRIKSLLMIPVDNVYIADIDLVNGMKSSYNIDIGFISEMTGTADIITENSRLIYRIIKPIKSVISK